MLERKDFFLPNEIQSHSRVLPSLGCFLILQREEGSSIYRRAPPSISMLINCNVDLCFTNHLTIAQFVLTIHLLHRTLPSSVDNYMLQLTIAWMYLFDLTIA